MPLLFNFPEHSSIEIEDFQYEIVEKYHGSWYFDIHDPTIHDPAMQDSCINYRNILQLCRENKVFGKVLFPEITSNQQRQCPATFSLKARISRKSICENNRSENFYKKVLLNCFKICR